LPARTIYLSSFSKTLGPALRVGFMVAPAPLVKDLRRRKYVASLSGDAYTQNLVADFVDRRGHQRHLVELREELCRRARIARREAEAFTALGRFSGAFTGGLFHRFDFAEGIDAMALYRAAREENVLLSPGYFFRTIEGSASDDAWMRVNVSRCEPTVLAKVLRMLARFVHG
jgi:DNA-binding transcriptional MocR family regulator